MKAKRFLLMLLVTLMSVTGAQAIDNVPYVDMEVSTDAEGHVTVTPVAKTANNVTVITSSSSTLSAGWYVVEKGEDVTTSTLVCEGEVHLILADGAKLTATGDIRNPGIRVSAEGASLTIYGQTEQSGQLIATGGLFGAGIGGGNYGKGHDITINGGMITATGGYWASAIGGGDDGESSNIFVNSSLVLYADDNNPPTRVIEHTSVEDISHKLSGKQYAIVRTPIQGISVTFDKQEGSGGNDQTTVNEGDPMPTITIPSREGYAFQGYFSGTNGTGTKYYCYDGTSAHLWDKVENTTLYAYWSNPVEYIDADGSKKKVGIDSEITNETTTLTKGWYLVRGADVQTGTIVCEGEVHLILADDAKLTATGDVFDAGIRVSVEGASLTIYGQTNQTGQLFANGGHNGAGIGGEEYGSSHDITINGGVITASGGYKASAIGGGRDAGSSNIFVNSSLVLYADGNNPPTTVIEHTSAEDVSGKLSGKQYAIVRTPILGISITFDKQEGSGGNDQTTVNEGDPMPTITIPSREGYAFQGYYASQNGEGTKYYNKDGTSAHLWNKAANTMLYAYWTQNSIVSLDQQSGSGGTSQITAIYETPMPTITIPSREGYVFVGYYSGKNGTGTKYYNNEGTSAHLWDKVGSTTLYAYWTQPCVVTLDLHGGSGGTTQIEAIYDSPMPTITVPTRDGATFNGYYAGEDGMGTKYYNADGTSAHLWDKVENATLYAYWKSPVSYIDADGNTKYAVPDVVTTTTTTMSNGWYVVNKADLQTGSITCEGAVHLILADGAKLTATGGGYEAGIRVSAEGASLTIYGQTNQTGQLIAKGGFHAAGIGGNQWEHGHDIIINGGVITAIGGERGAGIGGSHARNAYNITINGGVITAIGGDRAAGIGAGGDGTANNIIINGGVITASGGTEGCAIGGEYQDPFKELYSSNIFVNLSLVLYADNNNPPTTEIEHTSETDLAEVLSGKMYLTAHCRHQYADSREEGAAYYTCSLCGHIDPVRLHVHNYEWVVVDEHQHKQVCTSEVGTCIAREQNAGDHNIHESILCDTENHTCDVCGYVDEAKKEQFEARDYFSLKAVDGSVTLGMQKTGEPDDCTLQVSADGNNWSEPMTLSETTANIVTIPSCETRYFRRGSTTAADRISTGYYEDYWSFTMDGAGTIEADGNIMSLLDMTCQKNTLGEELNAFTKLFEGCEQLKTVTINSQVLLNNSNVNYVFGNGVSTYIIGTGMTSIGNNTFMQNSAITSVTIPEGIISIGRQAFTQCSGLTSIEIPSTVQSIGDQAFSRCQNIAEITMNCPSTCTFGSNVFSPTGSYKIIVPALTTHSWTSNPMWSTYESHFTEPTFTLHANQDPDNAGNYYTTFFNSHYAYTLPNGVKAYTATIGEENNEKVVMLTAIEGDILPKGTAVLLHSNTTGDMLMTVSNENGNEYGENLFSGVDVETAQSGTNYMLSYGQNGLGFYKMKEDMMLSANKTFLPQSAAMANARAFRMVFIDDNEVDGIQQIENGESETENSVIYNLNGMRMNKLQKGINIVNGKKIVVK